MRAIMNRLRRLENTTAPAGRERAAVEAILAARRRRLGASYEPFSFPAESYAGCLFYTVDTCSVAAQVSGPLRQQVPAARSS